MRKGCFGWVLVCFITLWAAIVPARGDEPAPTVLHARKQPKTTPKPPKTSDSCTSDADCALTALAEGAFCPTLCQPRPLSKASAEALEKWAAACAQTRAKCPVVDCAPPRTMREPACVSGKCVVRVAPSRARE